MRVIQYNAHTSRPQYPLLMVSLGLVSGWARCLLCVFSVLLSTMSAAALAAPEPIRVVVSFSILADFARQVGGEQVDVTSLIPANGDAHLFEPRPADVRLLAKARLVIVNGLGYEPWLPRLLQASGSDAKVVVASAGVTPAQTEQHTDGHNHGGQHDEASHGAHGQLDPHAWLDVRNAIHYVDTLRTALCGAKTAFCADITARADAYRTQLRRLHTDITQTLSAIPEPDRTVVSSHASFGYFARAYGMRFLSPLGINTEARPSARDMARVIDQVRAQNVRAVFLENINDPRLIERIVVETGARIGGHLYADALSPADGDAPTYIDMMRHNARVIATSLNAQ